MTEVIIEDDLNAQDTRTPEEIQAVLDAAVNRFNERPEPETEESVMLTPEELEEKQAWADAATEPRKKTVAEMVALSIAELRFKKALTERSFSGRNPELGPMIKCAQCGRRHRDNVKHDPIAYKEGTTQAEHGRPVANAAGFRAKPGKMYWIKELKKFVTINR